MTAIVSGPQQLTNCVESHAKNATDKNTCASLPHARTHAHRHIHTPARATLPVSWLHTSAQLGSTVPLKTYTLVKRLILVREKQENSTFSKMQKRKKS